MTEIGAAGRSPHFLSRPLPETLTCLSAVGLGSGKGAGDSQTLCSSRPSLRRINPWSLFVDTVLPTAQVFALGYRPWKLGVWEGWISCSAEVVNIIMRDGYGWCRFVFLKTSSFYQIL